LDQVAETDQWPWLNGWKITKRRHSSETMSSTRPGKLSKITNWKDPPLFMGKSTNKMAIFNSYVCLPEGSLGDQQKKALVAVHSHSLNHITEEHSDLE